MSKKWNSRKSVNSKFKYKSDRRNKQEKLEDRCSKLSLQCSDESDDSSKGSFHSWILVQKFLAVFINP